MTFEEKLDRLIERHEALTQSVESLAATSHEQSHRIDAIITAINQDAENIRGLVRIVDLHERRIEHLEDDSS